MDTVLLIVAAWGALDVAFVGLVTYFSLRKSARTRALESPAPAGHGVRTLAIGETSVSPTHH